MNQLPLRDIHLPEPVSWWPPAPGWWLLALLVIALLIITPKLLKKLKQKPVNKIALNELTRIANEYHQQRDDSRLVQQISILLRRVAMSYLPRQQSASITGEQWIEQLNSLTEENFFSAPLAQQLLTAPYQKNIQIKADELINSCKRWIKALPRKPARRSQQ